jgi:aspartyl-tRNA(Asn)/glutamyl-tRNA(Gln) amidotransferase subunit C
MPEIDRDLVEKIALLARLSVPPADADRFVAQMRRVVETVEKLNEVDTKGVEPLANPAGNVDAFRDDEPRPGILRAEALGLAPDKVEMFYRVPRVVE